MLCETSDIVRAPPDSGDDEIVKHRGRVRLNLGAPTPKSTGRPNLLTQSGASM